MMKRNYNELLIWSAAIVTVVRYAAAFIASDAGEIIGALSVVITVALGLSGLGMGILDVIGGAALFQGWRKAMPKSGNPWPFRFRVLTFFVFGLILNGIIIIVPFTVSRVLQESMKVALGGDGLGVWGWAAAVNVAPYMLIGGVAVSSNLVATESEQAANKPRTSDEQKANGSRSFATLSESDKLYIINSDSKSAAKELGVTPRAIQKWRKAIATEKACQ